jgi:hypothetical protein
MNHTYSLPTLLRGITSSSITALPPQNPLKVIYRLFSRTLGAIVFSTFLLCPFLLSCSLNPDPGDRYALVYGVAQYIQSLLNYSADDAIAVGNLLTSRGYREENVIVRTDTAATKTQLESDLRAIAKGLHRIPSSSSTFRVTGGFNGK